ncbi:MULTISPECIES: hypothetical protein [Bacillus]|uniref:hypothetical protein n=1 Tax=Bacillus TaxID=1386 RepID=UPI001581AC00|nr:hypothetical protein [Bacillus glycinifermentans]MBU8786094.1 hypothetical protein [Bacillus glycinifermentans]NUJ16751.1 hypothetical protein [Bacillus glycinifermentans]
MTTLHYFFKLHPLKIREGWKVKENHLYQKPIREGRQTLFVLENEENHKMIQVESAGDLQYAVKMFTTDEKPVADMLQIPYEKLVERLEEVIWKEGGESGGPRNLLRLRIPGGWKVSHHALTDTNPGDLDPGSDVWLSDFKRDLLQLEHEEEQLLLDVEWYPENDPAGHYAVKLIKDGDWKHPLEEMLCIHPKELAYELDSVLKKAGKRS